MFVSFANFAEFQARKCRKYILKTGVIEVVFYTQTSQL